MYSKTRLVLGMVALAAGLFVADSWAQGLKEERIESKAQPYVSAAGIDFSREMNLPFASLTTLGARVEQARRSPDPVGLAAAAKELAVAEQVSGKKAALTAGQLMKEAIDTAELRGQSAELRALHLMAEDQTEKKKLEQFIATAKTHEEEQAAAAKRGERARGITREWIVYNNTHQDIDVYYCGSYVGHINSHSHRHFPMHDHRHEWYVEARGHHGYFAHRHKHGDISRYTWTLNP